MVLFYLWHIINRNKQLGVVIKKSDQDFTIAFPTINANKSHFKLWCGGPLDPLGPLACAIIPPWQQGGIKPEQMIFQVSSKYRIAVYLWIDFHWQKNMCSIVSCFCHCRLFELNMYTYHYSLLNRNFLFSVFCSLFHVSRRLECILSQWNFKFRYFVFELVT